MNTPMAKDATPKAGSSSTPNVASAPSSPAGDAYTRERLESMLDFLTTMSGLFEEILRMPMGALKGVGKLRGKVITLLGSDKKKVG